MPRIPTQNAYFINPESERSRGLSVIEAMRGYAGAPTQASVMSPEAGEAYTTGETAALLEAMIPFAGMGKAALGGLGKAALAGIIAPGRRAAADLGIESVFDRAQDMYRSGRTQQSIAEESIAALNRMRNPGGATSMFIGPEGIGRTVISNENSRLTQNAPFKIGVDWDRGRWREHAQNLLGENDSVLLSDVLLHPSLYDISPNMSTATVKKIPELLSFLNPGWMGGYDPRTNTVLIAPRVTVDLARSNDARGDLQELLLHEAGHGLQEEVGTRGGASSNPEFLKKALAQAQAMGSYASPQDLDELRQHLDLISSGAVPEEIAEKNLSKIYRKNYGEAEAEAGSRYVPSVTPYRYLSRTW